MATVIFAALQSPMKIEAGRRFGVLVDGSDESWANRRWLESLCLSLMEAGCKWFVCFGPLSEKLHDRIDDVIIEHGYDGVTTTYHLEESREDVAFFFSEVVLPGLEVGVVLVEDAAPWRSLF